MRKVRASPGDPLSGRPCPASLINLSLLALLRSPAALAALTHTLTPAHIYMFEHSPDSRPRGRQAGTARMTPDIFSPAARVARPAAVYPQLRVRQLQHWHSLFVVVLLHVVPPRRVLFGIRTRGTCAPWQRAGPTEAAGAVCVRGAARAAERRRVAERRERRV